MGPGGALGTAEEDGGQMRRDEALSDWDVFHRCQTAHAILSARNDHNALLDARRALDGWNTAEIAAGRRGVCDFCLDLGPCTRCDAPPAQSVGAA